MKVSIKEDSPFRLHPMDALRCTVLFNDERLLRCYEADEERGLVAILTRAAPTGLGRCEPLFTTYQGRVKLIWEGEAPAYLPENK